MNIYVLQNNNKILASFFIFRFEWMKKIKIAILCASDDDDGGRETFNIQHSTFIQTSITTLLLLLIHDWIEFITIQTQSEACHKLFANTTTKTKTKAILECYCCVLIIIMLMTIIRLHDTQPCGIPQWYPGF